MREKHEFEILHRFYEAHGDQGYIIAVFGDDLAKREGYKVHRDIDAVHFYLVEKYKWLPAVVKALSYEDLAFLLQEEMHGWTLPEAARG